MNAFEITIIVLLAAIVVLLIVLLRTAISGFHNVWQKLDANCETLSNIRGDTVDIFQELNNIEDNILGNKMVDRTYPPTYVTPCYAPNGICTNPQMDCINCPKRGTGGSWSTSTNKITEE